MLPLRVCNTFFIYILFRRHLWVLVIGTGIGISSELALKYPAKKIAVGKNIERHRHSNPAKRIGGYKSNNNRASINSH